MYMVMNTRGDVFNLSPRVYENELKNYNCGGYALGIYEWWIPYMTPSRIENDYNEVYDEADYYEEWDTSEEAVRARKTLNTGMLVTLICLTVLSIFLDFVLTVNMMNLMNGNLQILIANFV